MRSKIFMSMMMIALVAALVGGATFALFTDATTNDNNTFAAGTVKIIAGGQVYSDTVDISNIAPGDVISGSFDVENNGSLKLWYNVTQTASGPLFSGATPAEVALTDPGWKELAPGATATVNYTVTLPLETNDDYQGATGTLSFTVDAEQFDNNPNPENVNP